MVQSMLPRFWEQKSLAELDPQEWESLCDGCAKCCLHKLEDEDSGEVFYTKVVCRYMDEQCRCTEYQQRNVLVPNCVWLKPEDVAEYHWLPQTCAYRLVAEGKPLPDWHHLISGDTNTVHELGISIKGRALSEDYVHPDGFEEHIIHWVE
jgi:uncharacterized cysteine cluster protein YcgN (CxxCxxCC family)